jgi:hypothetical protein
MTRGRRSWSARRLRSSSAAVAVVGLAVVVALGYASLRVPAGASALQRPLAERQGTTTWSIAPAYAFDALCFVQVLSGDPYYLGLFEGTADAAFARMARERLRRGERAAVDRIHGLLQRALGVGSCPVLSSLLAITGAADLVAFRAAIADPRAFRHTFAEELDVFYRRATGGFRLPGLVVDLALRDVATYLDALDRLGFEATWRATVRPELAALADDLSRGVAGYDVVAVVESLIGGGLPSGTVHVHLARFARPNGISLQATSLVMEERTDAPQLARVAAHELLHGWVDWTGDASLADLVAALRDEPLVARAFAGRDRRHGYNTTVALVEEALTQALDQLAAERLGVAPDPGERWFFHDGGLHVMAVGWHEALGPAAFDDAPLPLHERVAGLVAGGVVTPATFGRAWEAVYRQPCTFAGPPTAGPAYLSGDADLLALHPSYGTSVRPGSLIVFLRDWCVDGDPQAAVARLEAAARGWRASATAADGRELPLTLLHGGNWGVERDGVTHLYRHALTYRLPAGVAPEGLASPLAVRIEPRAGGG